MPSQPLTAFLMAQNPVSQQHFNVPPYDEPLMRTDSIRLLRLHPAPSSTEPLSGEFVIQSLSEHYHHVYQALSYMWGEEAPRQGHEIRIGETLLPLRPNLYDALITIREYSRQKKLPEADYLWIDSICIEQGNYLEKNHQVQHMGRIYFQANRVLIWLGQATQIPLTSSHFWIMTKGTKLSVHDAVERNHNASAALCRSLLNLHWTRTWILQEIGLAATFTIITETRTYTDTNLRKFMESLSVDLVSGVPQMANTGIATLILTRLHSIWNFRKDMRNSTRERPGLCEMIHWLGADSLCSVNRDKVFALLHITSASNEIKVDYHVERVVLFWRVLRTDRRKRVSIKKIVSIATALNLNHSNILLSTKRLVQTDNLVRHTYFLCRLGSSAHTTERPTLFGPSSSEGDQKQIGPRMLCFFNPVHSAHNNDPPALLHLSLAQTSKDICVVRRATFYPRANGTTRYENIDLAASSIKHLGSNLNIRKAFKDSFVPQSGAKRSKRRLDRKANKSTGTGWDTPVISGYLSIDPALLTTIFFLAQLNLGDCKADIEQVFPDSILNENDDDNPDIFRYIGSAFPSPTLDDPMIFIEDLSEATESCEQNELS